MAAAAADAALRPGLDAALAAIDERARLALESARNEVYIGFHELMPPPPQPQQTPQPAPRERRAPEASPVPTPPTAPKPAHEARPDTDGRSIQFEWIVSEPDDSPPVPVPPDLAEILGPEDVQAFVAFHPEGFTSSAAWWSLGLPHFTKFLLAENALTRKCLRESLEKQGEELHRERREWIDHVQMVSVLSHQH